MNVGTTECALLCAYNPECVALTETDSGGCMLLKVSSACAHSVTDVHYKP